MSDLVEFLRARLDEDEQWALAASKPYPHAEGSPPVPPEGVHWQWVIGANWDPVEPNPVEDEFVAPLGDSCTLATVETWPSVNLGYPMNRTYANEVVEMDAAAAGHIARHDPASVLRKVEAKRLVVDECDVTIKRGDIDDGLASIVLHALAGAYANHPEFREEWRV